MPDFHPVPSDVEVPVDMGPLHIDFDLLQTPVVERGIRQLCRVWCLPLSIFEICITLATAERNL